VTAASIGQGETLNSGNSIVKSYTYTVRGNLSSKTDARGMIATFDYGSISCPGNYYSDLYRTGEHRGQYGAGYLLDYAYGYNCNSGQRASATDPNGFVTTTITRGSSR
jgi:YD repeat-containing protein